MRRPDCAECGHEAAEHEGLSCYEIVGETAEHPVYCDCEGYVDL